jgi:dipeptidyl aminopeptidase/acylaminoacyl peptidase
VEQLAPPEPSFERLVERRQRHERNRRITAGVLGLAILAALGLAVLAGIRNQVTPLPRGDESPPRNGDILVTQVDRGIFRIDPSVPQKIRPPLVPTSGFGGLGLAMSPDGSRFAYTVQVGEGVDAGIWIYDLRTGTTELAAPCDPACPVLIDWAPDGSGFAVTDNGHEGSELWWVDIDGDRGQTIADFGDGQIGQPTFSPDGSTIGFSVDQGLPGDDGPSELWTVNADGSGLTLVYERPAGGLIDPAWSPDGDRIAFWEWLGPRPAIWVVDTDGTDPRRLYVDRTSGDIGAGAQPGGVTWSPDGERLAFVLHWQLSVIDADGTDLQEAIVDGSFALRPLWLPAPEEEA